MIRNKIGILAPAVLALALALAGCEHEQAAQPPAAPSNVGVTETTSQNVPAPPPPASPVNVSPDILAQCKIDFNNVGAAPKFDFDKYNVRPDESTVLQKVAECVTTGPLKGHDLKLVGRADPRGEIEYNFVLGEHRADSIRSYLTGLGVGTKQITTTSRGKLDATGHDEQGWQIDRRVDIDLQK